MRPTNANPSTSMIATIQNTSSRLQGPQLIQNLSQNPQQLPAPQQNPLNPNPNPQNPPNPNPLPMAQPQTAKSPKINPFNGDSCHFQTLQDELRLIFDGYPTAFQNNQGNEHWDNTTNCYDYSSWTDFNNNLEENFKPKIKSMQAIEHLKHAQLNPKTTDVAIFNQTFTYLLNQAGITDDQHHTQLYINTIPDWIQ
ncbi:hypothetical protein P691DRAFT_765912 [Macrolepiota fuliginosa MF-IS2]|uniref:Retrotransposon gag domain-containing protein n=1 Tax=Macrolepiota fuliginosa MF-IS2 TaxID=1400762 RepID=A0A9P5X199_9AGAR|nr:hypothetical protein P691DRAFT_765912 [Macrolepiota fuliginosa MF-IS2]